MGQPLANWNGTQLLLEDVRVPALDRGFLFGDAVYEVIRIYGGRPWLLQDHLARLQVGLDAIGIECDTARLARRLDRTVADSGISSGTAYVQVTRGCASRVHCFPRPAATANELIWVQDCAQDPYSQLRAKGVLVTTTPDLRWGRCDIKSTNLLANCLAHEEAVRSGAQEALLVGAEGDIREGSHSAFFGVVDGVLRTAPLTQMILPSVTRAWVLSRTRERGIHVAERAIHLSEVGQISEAFLAGTVSEILPVAQVDGIPLAEGVHPMADILLEQYRRELKAATDAS